MEYIVKQNETIFDIAEKTGADPEQIVFTNYLTEDVPIRPGDILEIPVAEEEVIMNNFQFGGSVGSGEEKPAGRKLPFMGNKLPDSGMRDMNLIQSNPAPTTKNMPAQAFKSQRDAAGRMKKSYGSGGAGRMMRPAPSQGPPRGAPQGPPQGPPRGAPQGPPMGPGGMKKPIGGEALNYTNSVLRAFPPTPTAGVSSPRGFNEGGILSPGIRELYQEPPAWIKEGMQRFQGGKAQRNPYGRFQGGEAQRPMPPLGGDLMRLYQQAMERLGSGGLRGGQGPMPQPAAPPPAAPPAQFFGGGSVPLPQSQQPQAPGLGEFQSRQQSLEPMNPYPQGQLGQGPLNQTAEGLASLGRGGDSMLMHVNKDEVNQMATSINPDTGLPEACPWAAIPAIMSVVSAVGGIVSSSLAGSKQEEQQGGGTSFAGGPNRVAKDKDSPVDVRDPRDPTPQGIAGIEQMAGGPGGVLPGRTFQATPPQQQTGIPSMASYTGSPFPNRRPRGTGQSIV